MPSAKEKCGPPFSATNSCPSHGPVPLLRHGGPEQMRAALSHILSGSVVPFLAPLSGEFRPGPTSQGEHHG